MWRIQDAHRWIDRPETSYERRRELRVRESRHTAMLFDKKYMDYESGKYITDKLTTLNSITLCDMIDDGSHNDITYWYSRKRRYQGKYVSHEQEEKTKFIPKDNDFEEECRRDEENKKYHDEICKQQISQSVKLKKKYLIGVITQEEQRKITEEGIRKRKEEIAKEEAYQQQVRETEARLAMQNYYESRIKVDSIRNLPPMGNIRPNSWKPK
jgi:hypothetical protein